MFCYNFIYRHLHLPTLQLAKMDLKSKRISMPEFVSITKKAIQNMKEAVRCMENFDLTKDGNSKKNLNDDSFSELNGK